MTLFKQIVPVLILGGILGLVIWQVQPPRSLATASIFQLLVFFLPFFLFLAFLINLYFQFILRSLLISLGITLLLILKSLNSLNIITVIIIVLAIILIFKSFKKPQKGFYQTKIPKLSRLQKQR